MCERENVCVGGGDVFGVCVLQEGMGETTRILSKSFTSEGRGLMCSGQMSSGLFHFTSTRYRSNQINIRDAHLLY